MDRWTEQLIVGSREFSISNLIQHPQLPLPIIPSRPNSQGVLNVAFTTVLSNLPSIK